MDQPAYSPPGYEFLGELGHGPSGIVYKARHTGLKRVVAIKTLALSSPIDRDAEARFMFEARVLAMLTSESFRGIPRLCDVHRHQGHRYQVREYVEGTTLNQRVIVRTVSFPEGVGVLARIARTIHEVHEYGLVHRNLHPSNILISGDGTPYLIGFGRVGVIPGFLGHYKPYGGIDVSPADVDVELLAQMFTWLLEAATDLPFDLESIRQRWSAVARTGRHVTATILADALDDLLKDGHASSGEPGSPC